MTATAPADAIGSPTAQVADALALLRTRLGKIQRPLASKRGVSGTFEDVSHAGSIAAIFEGLGAQIQFHGVIPRLIRGGEAIPLVTGMLANVAFTAHCRQKADDVYDIDVQLLAASGDAATGNIASATYVVCDELMFGNRVDVEMLSGYITHCLSRMKGKPKARLLAELAATVADNLADQAG